MKRRKKNLRPKIPKTTTIRVFVSDKHRFDKWIREHGPEGIYHANAFRMAVDWLYAKGRPLNPNMSIK